MYFLFFPTVVACGLDALPTYLPRQAGRQSLYTHPGICRGYGNAIGLAREGGFGIDSDLGQRYATCDS